MLKRKILIEKGQKLSINNEEILILLFFQINFKVIPTYWLNIGIGTNNRIVNLPMKYELKKLKRMHLLNAYSTLLNKREAAEFDYFLSSEFDNGLELRNKYMHGSVNDLSENEHKDNYMLIMYLFTLLIIKINEEFDHKSIAKRSDIK